MDHVTLRGNYYEMGVRQGQMFEKENILFPLRLDEFQRRHGRASESLLKEIFPEVCSEIKGISDTIGADYLSFASWMLCMGCCMYNLERNIPLEGEQQKRGVCSDGRQPLSDYNVFFH